MTDEKPRVIIIPPKPELQQTAAVTKQLRVAAYCRVSTNYADQKTSYATQIRVYQKMINDNPDWTLVDIFADEAVIIGLKPPSTNGRRFSPISITGHFPI